MNGTLLEIFLGYCKNGISIHCTGDKDIENLEMERFKYENKQGNFIIINRSNEYEQFAIPMIEESKVEEFDDYIHINNEKNDIYIEELV